MQKDKVRHILRLLKVNPSGIANDNLVAIPARDKAVNSIPVYRPNAHRMGKVRVSEQLRKPLLRPPG